MKRKTGRRASPLLFRLEARERKAGIAGRGAGTERVARRDFVFVKS